MKTIITMAREAGAAVGSPAPGAPEIIFPQCLDVQRFAALVRADEREACAKLCDVEEETANQETWYQCAKELAKQIRAKGNT